MPEDVQFETQSSREIKFGENNFVEIAHKIALTEEGERPFVSITRGYYKDGVERRFKKALTVPVEKSVLKEMASALTAVVK